jgi:hypothetical protein
MPQPLIEDVAINHADEAFSDRHIDRAMAWRDDPRTADLFAEQTLRNGKLLDQAGWDCSAAWFNAALAVKHYDLSPGASQFGCRSRSSRTAAYDDDIYAFHRAHASPS